MLRARDADAILAALPSMRAFARGLTVSPKGADDLVQRAVLTASRRPDPLDTLHAARVRLMTLVHDEYLKATRSCNGAFPQTGTGGSAFEKAFGALPAASREVLVLTYGARFSTSEAAQICRTDAATVQRRVDAALGALTDALATDAKKPGTRKADPV